MKDGQEEARPAAVPEAKQAGEVHARWAWVEPCVWTERMLTALEDGVKGGKWYSLIIAAPEAGLDTSNTVIGTRSSRWTVSSGVAYAAFCANAGADKGADVALTISAGPIHSLLSKGCFLSSRPMRSCVNP